MVLPGHGMIQGDEPLVLHLFHPAVPFRRFQRRKGDAAAGEHGLSRRADYIAAHGANIEFVPQHVGRAVLIA